MKLLLIVCAGLALSGCVGTKKPPVPQTTAPSSRYNMQHDTAPHPAEKIPDLSKIPEPIPKKEPKSKIGNPKSYTVFNKSYTVLDSSHGYKERGTASWYGKKFHGFKTSNGETYDMFSMTAAHKTLPLPTYLKVTNVKNGKYVIVKVNDRGPFHGDRIIDLSYAAAGKLGILKSGTAEVEIEAINAPLFSPDTFLQLGDFTHHEHAKKLADKLRKHAKNHKITIRKQKNYHIHIGPIADETVMLDIKKQLKKHDFPEPKEVKIVSKKPSP